MNPRRNKLIREQIEARLRHLESLRKAPPPRNGWIQAIREALGMTGSQLAGRLKTTRQRISRIEHGEVSGNVTIDTMRKTADALNCDFVYALLPRTGLTHMVNEQIEKQARKHLEQTSQTMRLEDQELTSQQKRKALEDEMEMILSGSTRTWWAEDEI